ncbi:ankyrin repeat domain-containing protein [Pedobacter psychrotolerans]|uniref:ankyrin repeat domain-containing protein n=1 Tax=Pedobacter psychrotolerans TaxID=1843235 RepID=UPI003F9CE20A
MEYELHKLAIKGDKQRLEELLLAGDKDVNEKNNIGYSPLAFAVINGHIDVVNLLIKFGADVNIQDIDGKSPLHYLGDDNPDSKGNQLEIAKSLIENGASISLLDNYKNNPLIAIVSYPGEDEVRIPLVKLLLENGADINHQNKSGISALGIAKDDNDENLILLFQKYAK